MQMSHSREKVNAVIYSSCHCLGHCDYKVRKGGNKRLRNPNHKQKKSLRDFRT